MKRKRLTLADWGHIPTTPVRVGRVTTPESCLLESIAEEAKRNVQRDNSPEQRAANLRTFNYWIRSLNDIAADKNLDAAYDELHLPKYSDADFLSVMKDPASFQNALAAFHAGLQALEQERGIRLTTDGMRRFGAFVQVQLAHGVRLSPSAILIMWDRLESLGILSVEGGGFIVDPSLIVPIAPAPAAPVAQAEVNREQLETDFYAEAYPLYQQWLDSLATHFGFHPSKADRDYLFGTDTTSRDPLQRGWFWRSNESPLSRKSYDQARLHMVNTGRWPETLLTDADRMDKMIESAKVPLEHLTNTDRYTLLSNLSVLKRR